MAWCPFAVHRPLSENHWQGAIEPRAVILHTAVSGAASLYGFFQHNSNLESHFYVNEAGVIEQYMDTGIMADANKNANSFAISIETEDGGVIKAWNRAQVDALVRLVGWCCDIHGIAKRQIPTAYGEGIGWHVQFGAPGPWTPSAKTCPGGPRIHQAKTVIIPRLAQGGGAPGREDDDMTPDQAHKLDAIHSGLYYGSSVRGRPYAAVLPILAETQRRVTNLANLVARQGGVPVDELADAVVPKLSAALLPALGEVMTDVLGSDNAAQAEAIVAEMARRLTNEEEN